MQFSLIHLILVQIQFNPIQFTSVQFGYIHLISDNFSPIQFYPVHSIQTILFSSNQLSFFLFNPVRLSSLQLCLFQLCYFIFSYILFRKVQFGSVNFHFTYVWFTLVHISLFSSVHITSAQPVKFVPTMYISPNIMLKKSFHISISN